MSRTTRFLVAATACLALAACSQAETQPAPVIRPVLSVLVEPAIAAADSFVGTVVARDEIAYAFRIGGVLTSRAVGIGQSVTKGQALATLQSTSLQYALTRAQADLDSAKAQLSNATAAEARLGALQQNDNATPSQLDAAAQQSQALQASVAQAQSNLDSAQQQLDEATLHAEADGVVTSVDAEPGQVVAAGSAIVKVARPDARDVAIDVPENFASLLDVGAPFRLALQLDPTIAVSGRLREIAPQADPTTRARRVLIELLDPPAAFWIGTTATVTFVPDARAAATLSVPASAILTSAGQTMVWVVDESAGTVSRRQVDAEPAVDGQAQVHSGLSEGERVVVLGVDELSDGQKVRVETQS